MIVGSKVFPTSNPDWDVDHIMPVVGFTSKGLVFNTNEEQGQVEIAFAALSGTDGISFMSPTKKFYGYAVSGFRGGGREHQRVHSGHACDVARDSAVRFTVR